MATPYISKEQFDEVVKLKDRYKDTDLTMAGMLASLSAILKCEPTKHASWPMLTRWIESSSEPGVKPEFPKGVDVRPTASKLTSSRASIPEGESEAGPGNVGSTKREAQGSQVTEGKGKAKQTLPVDEVWVDGHHNPSMVLKAGHHLGTSANHPLPEKGVRFNGDNDWQPKENELYCRTITNFRFVNAQGEDICVVPGPGESPPFYLLGAAGTLDLRTESGQRLAAGWWQVPPNTARAEVIWLKVPVHTIGVDKPGWLPGSRVAAFVDSKEATYVLQCPHPEFQQRWSACTPHFPGFCPFVGISFAGGRPEWFNVTYWRDLKREYGEWIGGGKSVDPPKLSSPPATQLAMFEAEALVATHKAALRQYTADQTELDGWIQSAERSKSRARIARKQQEWSDQIEEWQEELKSIKQKINNHNAELTLAQQSMAERCASYDILTAHEGNEMIASGSEAFSSSAIDDHLNLASTVPSWETGDKVLLAGGSNRF